MNKILIVENSPTIISVADSLLRQRGYDVTCLSDGLEAYKFAKAENPDLILAAMSISGIDGIELCKKITSDTLTGGIPVVFLIGDKDAPYLDKIDLSGARGKINKPFSPKELLTIVEKFAKISETKYSTQVVNQESEGGPRLKPKAAPEEIRASTRTIVSDNQPRDNKHETVLNLDWTDLDETTDSSSDQTVETVKKDETGLVLDDDQYGLTSLADEALSKENNDEDYDWFINGMKEGDKESGGKQKTVDTPKEQDAAKPIIDYEGLESSASKDDTKYRRFLDKFKKDTNELVGEKNVDMSRIDIDKLVNEISEKLAQKIVAKIDKQEMKQIISSLLSGK
ncbi:MAG: response regulator [candidate division Zixibacteria bacterium]|nr:response regulator [candidate division Zixibacteria bacterium]